MSAELFELLDDIVVEQSQASIPWVIPEMGVYYRGVFLIAGAPKVGKSTLIADVIRARVHNDKWAGLEVRPGPVLLLTEEGPMPTAWRWQRSTAGDPSVAVMFRHVAIEQWADERKNAVVVGMPKEVVDEAWSFTGWVQRKVRSWLEDQKNALVIVDTLAVWGNVEDENDAAEATKAISAWTRLAQDTGACILLVHHARKSGGSFGEGIRGSSAILGTADGSWTVARAGEREEDTRRSVTVTSRMAFDPSVKILDYNSETGAYSPAESTWLADIEEWLEVCPATGDGRKIADLQSLWEVGLTKAKQRVDSLLDIRRLRREQRPTGHGGSPAWVYWRIPPATAPRRPLLTATGEDVEEQSPVVVY